jgi:protein SCO1/2
MKALCIAATLALPSLAMPTGAAVASLAPVDLARAGLHVPSGAVLDPSLRFNDVTGNALRLGDIYDSRPSLVILADDRCRQLCGPVLAIASRVLSTTGLAPGRDFNLVSINFNPAATSFDAARLRDEEMQLFPELRHSLTMLMPAPDEITRISQALGFTAVADEDSDRFAHPAVVYALTARGHVSAVLDALSLQGDSLRAALVTAGEGRIGSIPERLHVLCYGLAPTSGASNGLAQMLLRSGAALMLLGAGAFAVVALRQRRSIE